MMYFSVEGVSWMTECTSAMVEAVLRVLFWERLALEVGSIGVLTFMIEYKISNY